MATKLTPAQLAALDFLIAVGQQQPAAAVTEKPAATTPPAAVTAAHPAAAPDPDAEEKLVNRGGAGDTGGGGTEAGFLDDVVNFVEDFVEEIIGNDYLVEVVSSFEDLTDHLADALNGLPTPELEELGVRDATGTVVAKGQIKAMRKRPLSVNDLIALRDAQRKL